MKKLTKRYDDGSYGVADDLPFGENSHDFKNALILSLGHYEHSPLVPTAWFPGVPGVGWQPIPDEKCWTEKKYDMSTREGFIEFMIDHNLTLNHLEDLWGRWVAFNYMSRDYIKRELGGESDVL